MPTVTLNDHTEQITDRPYDQPEDYWRVREMLLKTYPITPTGFNWEIRRWDGWNNHRETGGWQPEYRDKVHLWLTPDGRVVGVAHDEGEGDACFEVHPDYRAEIEPEMIAWAEANLARPETDDAGNTHRRVQAYVLDYDTPRKALLIERGWEKMPWIVVFRRMRLGARPLPPVPVIDGYTLRPLQDTPEDYQRLARVINAGFNKGDFHTAREMEMFAKNSPSFRHDLTLVAELQQDGIFAAHVGFTYDPDNRRAIIEPVCTHPDHLRKGLARALMLDGFHRVRALGATDIYVDTGGAEAANAFYDAMGFTEAYQGTYWRKLTPQP